MCPFLRNDLGDSSACRSPFGTAWQLRRKDFRLGCRAGRLGYADDCQHRLRFPFLIVHCVDLAAHHVMGTCGRRHFWGASGSGLREDEVDGGNLTPPRVPKSGNYYNKLGLEA